MKDKDIVELLKGILVETMNEFKDYEEKNFAGYYTTRGVIKAVSRISNELGLFLFEDECDHDWHIGKTKLYCKKCKKEYKKPTDSLRREYERKNRLT
jgi:hypothetical protein